MIAVVVRCIDVWFIPFEPQPDNLKQCMYDGPDAIRKANEMAKLLRNKKDKNSGKRHYQDVTVMEVLDCAGTIKE